MYNKNINKFSINNIRILSLESIEKSFSGHPGSSLSMCPILYIFFQFFKYDIKDPLWINRDIIILSNGHVSILLYVILFIFNIKYNKKNIIEITDIKKFRQLDSKCSGHPEYFNTIGIESTTGLLGQGIAIGIGIAIAITWKNKFFNKKKKIYNSNVYIFCGDGCLMEGISYESLSLINNLKIKNITIIYDKNNITIDGNIKNFFKENIKLRVKTLNFLIINIKKSNKIKEINKKIKFLFKNRKKSSFIIYNSIIGFGSPNLFNSNKAHGRPFIKKEIMLIKKKYNWNFNKNFLLLRCILSFNKKIIQEKNKIYKYIWNEKIKKYKKKNKKKFKKIKKIENKKTKKIENKKINKREKDIKNISNTMMNKIFKSNNWFLGGSADLSNSTKTILINKKKKHENNIKFGAREIAMSSIINGINLMNINSFCSTFLVFSDYIKPCIRIAALMKISPIFILTHDSFSIGEDGATHQPIEQINSLRLIPNIIIMRPSNKNELKQAWNIITKIKNNPIILILPKQQINEKKIKKNKNCIKGFYSVFKKNKNELIILSSGEELNLCIDIYNNIKKKNKNIGLYSMFSLELFNKQQKKYKDKIKKKKIIFIEKSNFCIFNSFINKKIIEIKNYGESCKKNIIEKKFNFNQKNILNFIKFNIKILNKE